MGGPRSMELAGEIADGLHTAAAYSPEALAYAVECFEAGVERTGEEPRRGSTWAIRCSARSRPTATRRGGPGGSSPPSTSPRCRQHCLERHGISPEEVAPVNEAFVAGDVRRALAATPDAIADRLVVAGTPDDWLRWLTETYFPAGLDHALVSFTDPFTLRSWAGIQVEGLPGLREQIRLFGERVLPQLS